MVQDWILLTPRWIATILLYLVLVICNSVRFVPHLVQMPQVFIVETPKCLLEVNLKIGLGTMMLQFILRKLITSTFIKERMTLQEAIGISRGCSLVSRIIIYT